jgi:hypothetical protein
VFSFHFFTVESILKLDHVIFMGAVLSTVIYCSISVHFDLFFIITTVLGIRLKLAFLPPFYKLDLTFVSVSLHPHPAGTPDALYLVPACAASHHPVDRTLRLLL